MSTPADGAGGRVARAADPPPTESLPAAVPQQGPLAAYTALFDRSSDGVVFTSPDGRILSANPAACRLLGRDEADLRRLGQAGLADPADERWALVVPAREEDGYYSGELRMQRSDGRTFTVRLSSARVPEDPGSRAILLFTDLSPQTDAVARAGEMQRAAATVIDTLESISDSYFAVDKHWVVTYINSRAEELLKTDRWSALGRDFWETFPGVVGTEFEEHYRAAMRTGDPVEFEGYYAEADLRCEVRAYPLHGGGMGVYFRDIADRYEAQREREWLLTREQSARAAAEAAQKELTERATRDNVTGLLNRWGLLEEVRHALTVNPRISLTVMFIDLDRFKLVNDTLGHVVGDQLLEVIGKRLGGLVRPTDLLARFGGDEFVIVLRDAPVARAENLARRIVAATAEPVALGRSLPPVTASVGISRAAHSGDINALLSEADAALYRVKDAGRDGFAWFDERLHQETVKRVQTERDLREALAAADQLSLHYQPAFDLSTGRVSDIEALSRWQHPSRGQVPPGEFVPVAEESGLVLALGERVIAQAAVQAARWADVPDLTTWVNISPRHLALPGLADVIERELSESGVPPDRFGVEVTESTIADNDRFIANLRAVRATGVSVAIDDFGTGYSSLSRLSRMPVDVIKVDQTFVADVGTLTGDAMLAGVVSLAHSIGARVVAEGIETPEQLRAVTEVGADAAAGFLLARPCPPDEVDWRDGSALLRRFAAASPGQVT